MKIRPANARAALLESRYCGQQRRHLLLLMVQMMVVVTARRMPEPIVCRPFVTVIVGIHHAAVGRSGGEATIVAILAAVLAASANPRWGIVFGIVGGAGGWGTRAGPPVVHGTFPRTVLGNILETIGSASWSTLGGRARVSITTRRF